MVSSAKILLAVVFFVGGPILGILVLRACFIVLHAVALANLLLTIFFPEINHLVHQVFWTTYHLARLAYTEWMSDSRGGPLVRA